MKSAITLHLFSVALAAALWATSPGANAAEEALPQWRVLEFESKSMWGTANSRIEFTQKKLAEVEDDWRNPTAKAYLMPSGAQVWELNILATVGSNEARLQLLMEPHSAAILQRDRFTIGRKNRRNKFYRYHDHGVSRVRQEPLREEVKLAPAQWSQSSLQEVRFPELPENSILTTPYALLLMVSTTALEIDQSAELFVHTDFNLYRVSLRRGKNSKLKTNYLWHGVDGKGSRYQEESEVETIELQVEPTSLAPDKPDFELMGLSGKVTILVDSERRVPLRIMGTAPRIGKTHLDLVVATAADHDGSH
jgi:hypothetical protein